MRALKQFMRNRKKEMLACGPCSCRTLQCRRYANENCDCGDFIEEELPAEGDGQNMNTEEEEEIVDAGQGGNEDIDDEDGFLDLNDLNS